MCHTRRSGLSLIEIMVTVTLLVVIILGLTAMFNQTRKAFTVGLGNVEYQDAGRAAMDLISRDLQQMAPSSFAFYATNFANQTYLTGALNFYVSPAQSSKSYEWPMNGGDTTNFSMVTLYFLTRYNQQWTAVGYRLANRDVTNGVGTLYRFSTNSPQMSTLAPFQFGTSGDINLNTQNHLFRTAEPSAASDMFSRVIDGVVDFRVRVYDRNGMLIPTPVTQYSYVATNNGIRSVTITYTGNAPDVPFPPTYGYWIEPNTGTNPPMTNYNIFYAAEATGDYQCQFQSNAVPAYVDIELGILETPTYQKLLAYTNTPAIFAGFLTNHASQVHIFRQRVTISSTDPAAYP